MDLKTNKKGFTLIELLAVIVVLALILVLTVPSILNTMNNTKLSAFKMYGERILEAAMGLYESQSTINITPTKSYDGLYCYTIGDLGIENSGSYEGVVTVSPKSSSTSSTQYTLYLTDGLLYYTGTGLKVDAGEIGDDANTDVTAAIAGCRATS